MQFILSALKRSCERRFWRLYAYMAFVYLLALGVWTFISPESYHNPGLTEFGVKYFPYLFVFAFFGIGLEHEIKARRAQKTCKKEDIDERPET